jgi:hypothetical protein
MTRQEIRVFPHSRKEFPSEDLLMMWLLHGLRGRGGVYHLKRRISLPVGSIVMFRYVDKLDRIIGEAVVAKETQQIDATDRNLLTGKEEKYAAEITFAPSSIRLYAPPVPWKRVGKPLLPMVYGKLDWNHYAIVLEEIASTGAFIS